MNKLKLFFVLVFAFNINGAPEGAFNTLMVKAKNVDAYVILCIDREIYIGAWRCVSNQETVLCLVMRAVWL